MSSEERVVPPGSIEQWEELVARCTEGTTVEESGRRLAILLPNVGCCNPLMQLMIESSRPGVRQLSAVLLHQQIAKYWKKLKQDAREKIKKALLNAILREQNRSVAVAVVEMTAEVALMCVPIAEHWPSLLPFVRKAVNPSTTSSSSSSAEGSSSSSSSDNGMGTPRVRSLGMRLLRTLLCNLPGEFRNQLQAIVQFLQASLKDSEKEVRQNALRALIECINVVTKPKEASALVPVIPVVISYLRESIKHEEDEDQTIASIDFLSELLSCDVPVTKGKLGGLLALFFEICGNRSLSQFLRNHAFLWFTHAAQYAKKELLGSGKLGVVVTMALSYAAEFRDDDADLRLSLTPYLAGCELIDFLIQAIKPSHLYKPVLGLLNSWFTSKNPLQRRVSVAVLGLLSETYQEEVSADLLKILPIVANKMRADPVAMVREAACLSMSMLARSIQPEMSQQHKKLLPVLVKAVDDPDANVRPKAIGALNVYCEHLDFDLGQYLRPLVSKLVQILYKSPLEEQEMALSSIAAVAASADNHFAPYAGPVLKFCKQAMECEDPERSMLRARATECLGLVASSVGVDYMRKYCRGFLELALKGFKLRHAHELSEFTLSLFSNFCIMLKLEFLPFAKVIVQLVLHIINTADDPDRSYDPRQQPSSVPRVAGLTSKKQQVKRAVSVRESLIDEKAAAIQAIGVFANALGPAYETYLQDSINCVIQHANDYHPDVRKASFVALSELLGAVYLTFPADEQWVPGVLSPKTVNGKFYQVFDTVFQLFTAAILSEHSPSVVSTVLEQCGQLALIVGPAALKKKYLEQLKLGIFAILSRKAACQTNRGEENDVDDDRDIVQLYYDATDLLLDLSKVFAGEFKPVFDAAFPVLLRFADETSPIPYREGSLGTIAEILRNMEHCGPYLQKLWPVVQSGIQQKLSEGAGLRRNCAYCIGILARTGDKVVLSMLGKMANLLKPLLPNQSAASDNAAGSLARIVLHGLAFNQPLPFAQIIKSILEALPICSDYEPLGPIVDCVIEAYKIAFKDAANTNSQALVALTPDVVQKLGPMLAQSYTYKNLKENRNNPLTEQQEARILEDELEDLLASLFRKLMERFSAKLEPVLDKFTPEVRQAFADALKKPAQAPPVDGEDEDSLGSDEDGE